MSDVNWQPTLTGLSLRLRPLKEDDFELLFAAGADPQIWEQHPERDRYEREKFTLYFRSGLESMGALAIIDQKTDKIVGSSRFTRHDPEKSSVEVGYTFLARPYWGKGFNQELKTLMLNYAFQFVDSIFFFVGDQNHRSQKAMLKLGAVEVERISRSPAQGNTYSSVVYRMERRAWLAL